MNTYASSVNKNTDQWPTLQSKHPTQNQKSRINPAILSTTSTTTSKSFSGETSKPRQFQNINPSTKSAHDGSKNNKVLSPSQQRPSFSIHKSLRNCENTSHGDRWVNSISTDERDEGWVTVTKKTSKKGVVETKIESQTRTEKQIISLPAESKENITDAEKEKKRNNELRKEKLKEEKKMRREEKARKLREEAKRDTRVNIISQDMINLFSSKSIQNSRNSTQSYSRPFGVSLAEYPNLGSQNFLTKRNEKSSPLPYTADESSLSASTSPATYTTQSNPESSSLCHSMSPNLRKEISGNLIIKEHVNQSPAKRKVKSRDLINLEIMDLIKENKKLVTKNKAPVIPIKKINTVGNLGKGKIYEGKKKKLSPLKNNILREKKRQEQLLLTLLNGLMLQEKNDSTHESSSIKDEPTDSPINEDSKHFCAEVDSKKEDLIPKSPSAEVEENSEENKSTPSSEEQKETVPRLINCNQASQKKPDSPELLNNFQMTELEARRELIRDARTLMSPIHSNKFREYCNHIISAEIDKALTEFIQLLIMFQRRLYMQDPVKAKMKRRYYCGFKEALKRLNLKRVTCVIMAPNLKPSPGEGCIDELVHKVLHKATEGGVPVIFGLTHRALGKMCGLKANVSCMAIVNIQGAQDKFEVLMDLVHKATEQYEQRVAKVSKNLDVRSEEITSNESATTERTLLEPLKKR